MSEFETEPDELSRQSELLGRLQKRQILQLARAGILEKVMQGEIGLMEEARHYGEDLSDEEIARIATRDTKFVVTSDMSEPDREAFGIDAIQASTDAGGEVRETRAFATLVCTRTLNDGEAVITPSQDVWTQEDADLVVELADELKSEVASGNLSRLDVAKGQLK